MFNNIGYIVYKNEIKNDEEILEIAIDVGADDVSSNEQTHEIITSISEFNNVREKLDDLLGRRSRQNWSGSQKITFLLMIYKGLPQF